MKAEKLLQIIVKCYAKTVTEENQENKIIATEGEQRRKTLHLCSWVTINKFKMGGILYKNKYRIKTARRDSYDYSRDGYYFVTICTKNRKMFFGDVMFGKIKLSQIGLTADKFWQEITAHFPFVKLDEFIVMPNHIHGIIIIEKESSDVETQNLASLPMDNIAQTKTQNLASLPEYKNKFGPQSKNLASIIRGFKVGVTKYANINKIDFAWQARFYDRIIRNDDELNKARQYITDNYFKWETDKNNSESLFT
jgi:putative transposase